mgnify:CR=1 FL=1
MAENALHNAQGLLNNELTPAGQAVALGSLLTALKARNGELAPFKHKSGATPYAPTEALSLDGALWSLQACKLVDINIPPSRLCVLQTS